jgi:hypothetical protein
MGGINNPSPALDADKLAEAITRAQLPLLDRPIQFTWRSTIRVGLGVAAEYGMLALIEDAPEAVKVATVLCALAGLGTLEFEARIRKYSRKLFIGLITLVAAIYVCFLIYAVAHTMRENAIKAHIDELYNESIPITSEANQFIATSGYSNEAIKTWEGHIQAWRNETETYLNDNIGPIYAYRFANTLGQPSFSYGIANQEVNNQLNFILAMQRNLIAIRSELGR